MEINRISLSRVRNAELVSIGGDVLKIAKTFDWEGLNVLKFYSDPEKSLNNLMTHLHKMGTVKETNQVELADEKFNNAWRAWKYICNCYLLSPDDAKREAAEILTALNKTHGNNLHLKSYQEQNGKAVMFVDDCDNKIEVKDAITLLGVQEQADNVKNALAGLLTAIDTRYDKSLSEKSDAETRMLRQKFYDDLDGMYRYIESMSRLDENGELAQIGKKINEITDKLELSIKLRNKQKNEETGESNNE